MLYIKDTSKTVDQAAADLEASAKRHGFGLLHAYDFKQTLRDKGFDLANECRVLEICNPALASEILATHMSLNMALPCRVSVYEEGGTTKIGMIPPTALLSMISDSAELREAAEAVEQTVTAIIDESI